MQRQGDDDFAPESFMAASLRERGIDLSSDPYLMPRHGVAEQSSCYYRSLSPKGVEENRTAVSMDKGDYNRLDPAESLQPLVWQVHKRPDYHEMILNKDELGKRHELCDNVVGQDAKNINLRYEYDSIGFRDARCDDVKVERLLRATEHEIFRKKPSCLQDKSILALDSESNSKYVEGGRSLTSVPELDLDRLKFKGACYTDPFPLDNLTAMEMYGRGERLELHSNSISYPVESTSQPKDFISSCHAMGNATGISRGDYLPSFQDNVAMQDIHSSRPAKFRKQLFLNERREEFIFHAERQEDGRNYYHDRCNASRTNDHEYFHPKAGPKEDYDDHGYLSEGLHRRMNFNQINVSPLRVLDATKEKIDISLRNLIGCCSLDHHSSRIKLSQEYLPSRQMPAILHEDGFYKDSRNAYYAEKQNGREVEMPNLCISQVGEVSRGILNHDSDKDVASKIYYERWRKPYGGEHRMEMPGHEVRTEKIESCVHGTNNQLNWSLKRKYSLDNEMIIRNSSGITMNGRCDVSNGVLDRRDQDAYPLLLPKSLEEYEHEKLNAVAASHYFLSSHSPMEPSKKQTVYKKSRSLSWHNPSQHSMKHSLPKNVWVRGNIDKQTEVHENKVKDSKSILVGSEKSVLPEDSNKFDLLVQKFFLFFTKKLNDLPTRKWYKEKGKADSFLCIACGKRQFKDAQSLGAHCFMSQNIGLKAKHLGLLKAICVLMGWNTVVGTNVTAWIPEPISSSNATAQREDLILWPPIVVIHNCTKSCHGPKEQQVKTLRKIEDLLRDEGFGFSKIKICLGKPGNGSVVVVKFLATFPGLKDAEKLHNYFKEKMHGRKDFNDEDQNSKQHQEGSKGVDELHELVLYGYMGIAEDLDKVDNDLSSRCLIKSKKEIHDFVDAPIYSSKHQP